MAAISMLPGNRGIRPTEAKKETYTKGIAKGYRSCQLVKRKEIKLLEIEVQKNPSGQQSEKPNCYTSTISKIRTLQVHLKKRSGPPN